MDRREKEGLLRHILSRIEELEDRVTRLTSRSILDERKVPAREGEFEAKSFFENQNGVFKEVRVGYCDMCGRKPEEFNICTSCKRKLCKECSIEFNNRVYCFDCINEILPLNKEEYCVLAAIADGIKDLDSLEKVLKMKKEKIMECLKNLVEEQFVEIKGFLFFSEIRVLNDGLEALKVYRPYYKESRYEAGGSE